MVKIMKMVKSLLPKALMIFLIFSVVCGILYTGAVTGLAQLLFPDKANGSIIEVDGKKYGCELLGQLYADDAHMWGRNKNIDDSTYQDEDGNTLMYAAPSNLSPASEEYEELVAERVEKLRAANPDMDETAIPVDLVTCSGSGLDPHISPEAAEGGPLAIVHDGDEILIDVDEGVLELHVSDDEIAERYKTLELPKKNIHNRYLRLYAKVAASADEGAIIKA